VLFDQLVDGSLPFCQRIIAAKHRYFARSRSEQQLFGDAATKRRQLNALAIASRRKTRHPAVAFRGRTSTYPRAARYRRPSPNALMPLRLADHLAVVRTLDLQPGRRAAARRLNMRASLCGLDARRNPQMGADEKLWGTGDYRLHFDNGWDGSQHHTAGLRKAGRCGGRIFRRQSVSLLQIGHAAQNQRDETGLPMWVGFLEYSLKPFSGRVEADAETCRGLLHGQS
jgi:hypothetical protein